MQDNDTLTRMAKTILDYNWTGGFTRPSSKLYSHQWSWDSALIAIGYARYDQDRAARELTHLLESRWTSGLLPHEVQDPHVAGASAGGLGFFGAKEDPRAPDDRQTTGEVQPPVQAIAALRVYEHATDQARAKAFLEEAFPRLKSWHGYLYRERDSEGEGLVYVRHPWETGTGNSPAWDLILQRMQLEPDDVPDFQRGDLKLIPAEDRPRDTEYDRYAWLVRLFAERDYDEAKIREDCPFLVQDALFNALLYRSDRDLAEIARVLGEDPPPFEDRPVNAPFRFGASQFTTTPWSFEEDVEGYAALGVDAIEVCEAGLDEERFAEQPALIEQRGLTISSAQPALRTLFPGQMQPESEDTGERVFVAQVSDWRTPRSSADRRVVGEGDLPLPLLLRAIHATDYRGPYTPEIFSEDVPDSLREADLSEVIAQSRGGLERAWRRAGGPP